MKFFETTVYLPVGQFDVSVTTEEPRIPTAFEWQIVQVVDLLQRRNIASGATMVDVFRSVLGCDGVETFVKTALKELFSSTVDVLRTDNYRVPLEQLPISDINLTDSGRRLLKNGRLPSAPRTELREVFFDFAKNAIVLAGRRGSRSDFESPDKLPLSLVEGVSAPIDLVRAEEEKHLPNGCQIREIHSEPVRKRTYFWRAQRLSFSVKNGTITLDPVSTDANDGTDRYLRALTPEVALKLFFEKPFAATGLNLPSNVVDMPHDKVLSLRPASGAASGVFHAVPIAARLAETPLQGFRPEVLEVVFQSGDEGLSEVKEVDDSGVFQLTVLGNPCGLQPGCVTDGNTVCSCVRVRCYYGGMPLELPVNIERQLDSSLSVELNRVVNEALLSVPTVDRYTIGYLLSKTSTDRAKLLERLRLNEAESAVGIVNRILNVLERRGSSNPDARVLEELFSSVKMDSISGIRSAFDMLRSLDVSAEARKQCVDAMRKRLSQQSVGSPAEWIDCVTLYKSLGGNWTFDEKGGLVRILSRPGVSSEEFAEIKKTLEAVDGRIAWLDVAKAVLKNGNVRLSPALYVERAKALSIGGADLFGEMMRWFVELADWKEGFTDETERNGFFAEYGLKLPAEKGKGARVPIVSTKPKASDGKKEPVRLVPISSLIIVDGSNLVGHDVGLRTRALEAVLKAFDANGYKYKVFFDKSIFGWLKKQGDQRGFRYVKDGEARGAFFIAPSRAEADGQILQMADKEPGEPHVVSLDNYADRAGIYPWVLNKGAGCRVHGWNFVESGTGVRVLIADFNLDIVIPNARLTVGSKGRKKP